MSEFVLNRNYTHRSTSGHIINFIKNEPVYVPPVCRKEVTMLGAVSMDETIDVLGEETLKKPELTPDERREALVKAFKFLQERNHRGDFTGQGAPSVAALKKIIEDFEVDKKEVEELWTVYREEQNA